MPRCGIWGSPACRIRRPAGIGRGESVQVLPQWSFRTRYCGELWALYPATRHLPPRLSAFVQFLAQRLAQEPALAPGRCCADGVQAAGRCQMWKLPSMADMAAITVS
jgi:hypothetical protein